MNKDTVQGSFKEIKGKIKSKWGKLTDDDLKEVEGNMEVLAGKIQKVYGKTKEEAEKEVREFKNSSSTGTRTDSNRSDSQSNPSYKRSPEV